jgi:tetratricopeptide (TPR) repeat protein
MSARQNPESSPEGAAASDAAIERPLNVVLSLVSEPFPGEEALPTADESLTLAALSGDAPVLLGAEPAPPLFERQDVARPRSAGASLPTAPFATEAATSAGAPVPGTEARHGVLPRPGRDLNRLAEWFSPRVMRVMVLGAVLLFLVLVLTAWSTPAAGVIFPDWGVASLRIGLAGAILGSALLFVFLVIWLAKARPTPASAGSLGLLLVCIGAGGILGAAPLHRLQGRWYEGRGQYGLALAAYQASGDNVAQSQDMARISVEWAEQLSAQQEYGTAIDQIEPVVRLYKGDAALVARARMDLIADYLAWGDQARQHAAFREALAHYQALQKAAYCDAGCQAQVHTHAAQALLGLAQQLTSSKQYDEAVAAYQQLVQLYGDTSEAEEATLALTAPQALTGHLVYANKTPAAKFEVLLASQWDFNATTQVFTLLGQRYSVQTDASGLFVLPSVAVGVTYMIAWVDTGGHAGTCLTTNNQPLYTVHMQPLRAIDAGNMNIECT